jgi:hypothetical protein
MQKNFTNENFEDYLKQNADQLRLTPSLKAWRGIEKRLKKPLNWSAIVASAFLLSASLFGYLANDSTKAFFGLKPQTTAGNKESTPTEEKSGKVVSINKNKVKNKIADPETKNEWLAAEQGSVIHLNTETVQEPILSTLFQGKDFNTISNELQPALTLESSMLESKLINLKRNTDVSKTESVTTSLKQSGKKHKTELEFFFTPTVSYRKLSENKSYIRSLPNNVFSIASNYDVNNMVTHKPHIGLEFGFALKYRVARAVKIRSGLQFNINGYEIRAYNNYPELATISLNNRNSVQSVNTISTHRNFSSGQADWLKNTYLQFSAPVGMEVKLYGNDKVQFGVASTVQPTYLLGDKAYLISNDYKNYSQVPSLMRRWNVNTSLETFVAYSTGTLKWQIGPQVRYQLLSSFASKYPVKENLIDFGLKVGVSLNKK